MFSKSSRPLSKRPKSKQAAHKQLAAVEASKARIDRIMFKGYLPLTWSEAMERLIAREGVLNKDFKKFVSNQFDRVKEHAKRMAEKAGRPYVYLQGVADKEDTAKWIAERDGMTQGLVCVLSAVEPCQSFKVWREGVREGREIEGWFPMAKGVANLRCLNAPAAVENLMQAQQSLACLAKPLRRKGRSHKGFNPALSLDIRLFAAVVRGEHAIMGFRNADIRARLFGELRDAKRHHRRSAQAPRILKRLHGYSLIAKIPRSRW